MQRTFKQINMNVQIDLTKGFEVDLEPGDDMDDKAPTLVSQLVLASKGVSLCRDSIKF